VAVGSVDLLDARPHEHEVFLCECVRMNCTATIRLSMAEYKLIRSSAIRFSVAVGHDLPEFENVVAICDAYAVVERKGAARKP
jgi:hypothetical protein